MQNHQPWSTDEGQEMLLYSETSKPTVGPTQPPIQWVQRVRSLVNEADHSPPSITEVKNNWRYTSIRPLKTLCCVQTHYR